jgi:hypothetical protein
MSTSTVIEKKWSEVSNPIIAIFDRPSALGILSKFSNKVRAAVANIPVVLDQID